MFQRLINDAKTAVSSVILKYVARASVAVPFVIAVVFALAALTAMLIDRFGGVIAYWTMAGGLTAIGLITGIAVSLKEHEEEVADQKAEEADTTAVASEVAAQAPLALLGGLFAASPTSALALARVLGRNAPLVVLLALIGMLFWPTDDVPAAGEDEPVVKPNGSRRPSPPRVLVRREVRGSAEAE